MFTGIIEEVGTVAELALPEGGAAGRVRLEASAVLSKLAVGSSVGVNGCCLTVRTVDAGGFWCDLSPETVSRTSFRHLKSRARVNLEAPLTLSSPLGGHFIQGHVDATGTFVAFVPSSDGNHWLEVEVPAEWTRYVVEKGSVAIEGISLTVAALDANRLRAAIIPHTYENTNLAALQPGDPVNLEFDVLAKYAEKLLAGRSSGDGATQKAAGRLTLERLREEGF